MESNVCLDTLTCNRIVRSSSSFIWACVRQTLTFHLFLLNFCTEPKAANKKWNLQPTNDVHVLGFYLYSFPPDHFYGILWTVLDAYKMLPSFFELLDTDAEQWFFRGYVSLCAHPLHILCALSCIGIPVCVVRLFSHSCNLHTITKFMWKFHARNKYTQ